MAAENGEGRVSASEEDAAEAEKMKNKANEFFKCERHCVLTPTVLYDKPCNWASLIVDRPRDICELCNKGYVLSPVCSDLLSNS